MRKKSTPVNFLKCVKEKTRNRGLFIVEALVSIAVLVFAFSIVASVVVVLVQGQGRIRIARRLDSAAFISMERMTRTIRGASSFDLTQSIFNAHPGKLSVIAADGTFSTTTTFYLSGTTLMLDQNGVTEGPLTAAEVSIDSLVFRRIATPVSEGVRIEMRIGSAYGTTTGKAMLYTTVFARGSY